MSTIPTNDPNLTAAHSVPSHQPAAATPVQATMAAPAAEVEEVVEIPSGSGGRWVLFTAVPSWMVSSIVHFLILIVLAFITVKPPDEKNVVQVVSTPTEALEQVEEIHEEKIAINVDEMAVSNAQSAVVQQLVTEVATTTTTTPINVDIDAAAIQVELSDFGSETAPKNDLMATVGAITGSGVSGRGEQVRGQMVAKYGGTEASEAAVARALQWFAKHQLPDGSWNFDHRIGPCKGQCGDAGNLTDCRTGATAMALLPFLGAGQTHKQGKYKKNVEAGLYFLASQMKVRNGAGDLAQGGGSMYSHGLASIALCESYAMTHDKSLMAPAQLSLNHIVYAQDPVGGGWRYAPRTPGDTSVVGWQLMALKSGHMAYLRVPESTVRGAAKFLDHVQTDSGAKYGYTDPGGGLGTTSVGLLCRMYLGWTKDNPALERGVKFLSKTGPSKTNMYYNYYATQVMRHYEGEMWDKWNKELRDYLVETQDKKGHQNGSWYIRGDHGADRGGRLYVTSMATMILEVYYRHMPIYGKQAAEEEFPL